MEKSEPTTEQPTVFLVDDDQAVRRALEWVISSVGLQVQMFGSASEFLNAQVEDKPGCLLLDIRMPGMSGLDLLDVLRDRGFMLPVIMMTGHGDVDSAVRAMQSGAVDFLQKPFNDQVLLDRIQQAIRKDANLRKDRQLKTGVQQRLATLSAREKQVLNMIVAGQPNKAIAAELGLSQKTVEHHRARVMQKMAVGSLAELVSQVVLARPSNSEDACK